MNPMENLNAKRKTLETHDEEDREELKSVPALQRQHPMEAKNLGSDLDFAFQLQMQESIAASLFLHHPSTSQAVADVVPPPDDMGFDYASFMLEDFDRFEIERMDTEETQEEIRKFRNDLNRSIHDRGFARYIMHVPEEEWKEYGNWYERPYDENDTVSTECFRVFVKGLVSVETVGEMAVMVGGVGVAICDSKNNLIREVGKKLEGAELVSAEMAGVEAVIRGLSEALTLDLKRITVLVDDCLVYQYITGRLQPRQSKMGTIVNNVALLQKKFSYCQPSFVTHDDMKFAFNLARDAIVSQIAWPAETSNGRDLKETCLICFEDIDAAQMLSVDGCFHRYCFSCMKQHVKVKLLNAMVARCPHEGCNSEVSIDSCAKFLDPKLVEIMRNRKKEASIPVSEKVYCAFPTCSALMSGHEVLRYTNTEYLGTDQSGARKCVKCRQYFCIYCKVPFHYNMSCYEYKKSNPDREDAKLNSLAEEKLWRQCMKCKNMVELAAGCYHITCRCGYEFCYTCGAQWVKKKPTCSCPIWDERNLIRGQPRMQ